MDSVPWLADRSCQVQDEESLVRRAKNGDEKAFGELYEAHFNRIYRYVVVRIGDRMEAEDVTQQVFVHAISAMSSFKWQGRPFIAWLFRIAHNQVVDYLRVKKKQERQSVPLVTDCLVSDVESPERTLEYNLGIQQLAAATKRLTDAQREVISLRFAGDLPIAEVARIMGKSEGAIKALQHSAILALRKILVTGNDEQVQRV